MKFRKKPVIIEAEQFLPSQGKWIPDVVPDLKSPTGYTIWLPSLMESFPHEVEAGDWIVTESSGQRFVVDNDAFEEVYEPVEP